MKKNHIKKKKLSRECWNLDYELECWLYKHLLVYKKEARKIVDLEYHKFKYNDKEYTQLEVINRLIVILETLISEHFDIALESGERANELKDEMYDLLKLIHWSLWW